jgi:hypothetical protein
MADPTRSRRGRAGDLWLDARHRAEAGDRLGRGVHARPRGPDSRLVPRSGRPQRVRLDLGRAFAPVGTGPAGRDQGAGAGGDRLAKQAARAGGGHLVLAVRPGGAAWTPAVLRHRGTRRRLACASLGHAAQGTARADPRIQPGRRGDLRVRRGAIRRVGRGAGLGELGAPAEPVRPRALRDGRRPARLALGRGDLGLRPGDARDDGQPGGGSSSSACSAAGRPTPS